MGTPLAPGSLSPQLMRQPGYKPASQLGPRNTQTLPSVNFMSIQRQGSPGRNQVELMAKHRSQPWPLKSDKLWDKGLFDEYLHKTPASVPGLKKSPIEKPTRKSPVKNSLDYNNNVQRSLAIADSLQARQQQQLEQVERRLQTDETRLRKRIEKRLLEVETKLHEALAEDRQSWQRRAQQNNSKHSPNGPKLSPSKKRP